MANQTPLSPGVYTSERELVPITQSIGATTLGTVGETLRGPAFNPLHVDGYETYQTYFGGLDKTTFPGGNIPQYEQSYIAKTYLSESNSMYATRVLGYSGYDAGSAWNISLSYVPNYDNVFRVGGIGIPYGQVTFNDLGGYGIPGLNSSGVGGNDSTVPSIYTSPAQTPGMWTGGTWGYRFNADDEFHINKAQFTNNDAAAGVGYMNDFPSSQEMGVIFSASTKGGAGKLVVTGSSTGNWYATNGHPWVSDLLPYPLNVLSGETFVISTNASGGGSVPSLNNTGFETTRVNEQTNGTTYNVINWNPAISIHDNGANTSNITPSNIISAGPRDINPLGYPCTGYTFQLNWRKGDYVGGSSGSTQGWTAQTSGTVFTWSAQTQEMVVAQLRSRGSYNGNTFYRNVGDNPVGPGVTSQQFSPAFGYTSETCDGTVSTCTSNTFRTINTTNHKQDFYITGYTSTGSEFSYLTNLDSSSQNYIPRVFGESEFDKNPHMWVEEIYPNALKNLSSSAVTFSNLSFGHEHSYDNYSDNWQPLAAVEGPTTPWIVSEVRGNTIYKLFRCILISDGGKANEMVKVSVQDIDVSTKTFTLTVRDFNDNDTNQVILESYKGCSLNPTNQNYIGKKVGTENGDHKIRSGYIMLDIDDEAPIDALPGGFQGYPTRSYSGATLGSEVISNPPLSVEIGTKTGWHDSESPKPFYNLTYDMVSDNIKRTYLGWSSKKGIDKSFFSYKGLDGVGPTSPYVCGSNGTTWSGRTYGFHFDNRVSAMTNSDTYQYQVGSYNFNTSGNTSLQTQNYYLNKDYLKFTVIPYGGFDGWDAYRKTRTHGDVHVMGGTNHGTFWYNQTVSSTCRATDYYAFYDGIRKYSNPEDVDISLFGTPGIDYTNNLVLVNRAIEMIENDRMDSLYVVNSENPTSQTVDSAIGNIENSSLDSNYTATYWPWVRYRDTENNIRLYLPPTGEVFRNIALTDNISYPWFAPAGNTRGNVNADRAQTKLTQIERDDLYEVRINPIATFTGVGPVIWGQKTLQNKLSALDRVNIRRLMIYLRKKVRVVGTQLLFEQNDGVVRQQFLSLINPILEDVRRDRGVVEYKVEVDSDLDSNTLIGKIFIKPTKSLEFIEVEFNITSSSVSFE